MKRVLIIVVMALLALAGWQAWQHWRLPADVVARVDGVDIPLRSLNAVLTVARVRDPEITRRTMLSGAIENHALARYHEQQEQEEGEHDHSLVDYSPEALYENQLFALVRRAFNTELTAYVEQHGIDEPLELLEQPLQLDKQELAPYLEVTSALLHSMTEEQEAGARQYLLGRYRFPGSDWRELSLWDIYSRLNIQLKVQMHEFNLPYIQEAVQQHLATQFVLYWFRESGEFSAAEVTALEKLVADRIVKEEMLHDLGLMHDIHDDNPALREAMAAVTDAEVASYYQANRDEFRWVESAQARHIRLDSQQQADEVAARLRNQQITFDEAVRQYSLADDKTADIPGSLGVIRRAEQSDDWLRSIAFVQPEGVPSAPFRSPQNSEQVYWEIVLVDKKEMGYMPLTDRGVHYEASKKLARQAMQRDFKAVRDKQIAAVDVRINKQLLGTKQ